jgi:hypothetical protein
MPTKTRSRKTSIPSGAKVVDLASGNTIRLDKDGKTWVGSQKTTSINHDRGRDGKYHEGGPFYTVDIGWKVPHRVVSIYNKAKSEKFTGPIFVNPHLPGFVAPSENTSHLDSFGATAVSRVSPTNPQANVAQQLGELHKDGIKRSLPGVATWRNRTKLLQAAGSEYLSAVFGWLPLVDEVSNVANTIRRGDEHLKVFNNGAGRNSHRDYSFDDETSTSEVIIPFQRASSTLGLGSQWNDATSGGTLTRRTVITTKRWFSGSFTYPSAPNSDSLGRLKYDADQANYLLGTHLTPDVLWELTPWSWAVDWFSNAGEVINNFTNMSVNGLVMRYGYMMEEKSSRVTHHLDNVGLNGLSGQAAPVSEAYMVSKVRAPANPFGFGLSWDGLSPQQLLITAALGITHLR